MINLLSNEETNKFIINFSNNISLNDVLIYEKYFKLRYEDSLLPTINLYNEYCADDEADDEDIIDDITELEHKKFLNAISDSRKIIKGVEIFNFCIMDKSKAYCKFIKNPKKKTIKYTREYRQQFFEQFDTTKTFIY
jgi:hypothetical protein